jgi:hypothetical protein
VPKKKRKENEREKKEGRKGGRKERKEGERQIEFLFPKIGHIN